MRLDLHIRTMPGWTTVQQTPRAARKAGLLDPFIHHYELHLLDVLYDIAAQVGVAGILMPGHRRTVNREPVLHHGMYFALVALGVSPLHDQRIHVVGRHGSG